MTATLQGRKALRRWLESAPADLEWYSERQLDAARSEDRLLSLTESYDSPADDGEEWYGCQGPGTALAVYQA